MIKKYFTTFLMAIMLAVAIPAMAGTASAQTRRYNNRTQTRYNDGYKQPNVYDRHRQAINIGVATGAGALLGALLGGKKGALIGGAAGVAGGYIITKKQQPRNYNYGY